jgi:hypothetical protein
MDSKLLAKKKENKKQNTCSVGTKLPFMPDESLSVQNAKFYFSSKEGVKQEPGLGPLFHCF